MVTPAPELVLGATPAVFAPGRTDLTVGYYESGVSGQLPLLLAELSGYFDEAGFENVTIVEVPAIRRDVSSGDVDFGVAPARPAFDGFIGNPVVPTVAGYKNYAGPKGRFGGDLLLAAPGLVEDDPATVIAFLSAYIRALQDLSDPASAEAALALLQASEIAVPAALVRDWKNEIAAFAPFDGGFGDLGDDDGLGELADYLVDKKKEARALDAFARTHTLNIAQAQVGLASNPDAGLVGPPTLTAVTVGLPMTGEAGSSPILAADEAGYFSAAGFERVEIMDVEQPLLGLLNGELDFGIIDAVDAADGASQGLPAVAIAGHANYAADGTYGGDVLLTTTDILAVDTSTATAFLIAYIQGLRDLAGGPAATTFAPLDGGFGSRDDAGGTGELSTYLTGALGQTPDLDELIGTDVLEFSQAWWGLPANPASATPAASPAGTEDATEASEDTNETPEEEAA